MGNLLGQLIPKPSYKDSRLHTIVVKRHSKVSSVLPKLQLVSIYGVILQIFVVKTTFPFI